MESQGGDSTAGTYYDYHATELSSSGGGGGGGGAAAAAAVGPLFVVLAIIMVLGVLAGLIGRVCSGRHWGVDTQDDFEGWVEKRCANCIDGDVEAPPPPPPPPPPDKPPEEAAAGPPPPEAPPAAPPPPAPSPAPAAEEAVTEAVPLPADEASPPVPTAEAALPPATPQDAATSGGATYSAARTEPLTFMQLYPSYSCRCPICCREGLFE